MLEKDNGDLKEDRYMTYTEVMGRRRKRGGGGGRRLRLS